MTESESVPVSPNLGIYGNGRAKRGNARSVEARKGKKMRYHPTTSERAYSPRELWFLKIIDEWRVATGRNFPTNLEVVQIAIANGWVVESETWENDPDPRLRIAS